MEDDVVLALDEGARGKLSDHAPVQTALLNQIETAQIRGGVARAGAADQARFWSG